MLGKLFKYEMKAMGRILLPVFAATFIMGIINGFLYMFMPNIGSPNVFYAMITMVFTIILIFASIATVILSYVLAIYRFQRNLLGREGYLMNTLPVSTTQNILAKLFTSMIYEAIALVVVVFSYGVFITMMIGAGASVVEFWNELWRAVTAVFSQLTGEAWIYIAEFTVLLIVSLAYSNLMFYACMSIGYSSNSHKALKSVGIYIGFYMECQIISTMLTGSLAIGYGDSFTSAQSIHMLMISAIVMELVIAAVYWFITHFFMKKRLNLQ